ncbi:uncharacterized protein LOC118421155 [Branchiostoma floridae]|uniref:Uncharacterized protein LOC118421155 n=1 Tax=Branchiostoma floridae TaxID=7739 RepID=A0A9J7LLY9_BRAFL|nr:uncharacterized protein LOC118421155 [Branchiostoma floridae]
MASLWNNGELVGQRQLADPQQVATQYPIRVARRNGDGRIYSGRIACLQLYDYAMTEEQIIAAREKCKICAIDTVFLLDRSSSIPRTGFNLAKQYIWGFAQCFTDQEIGVGVIAYECVPSTGIKLGIFTASNSADLMYAIGDVEFTGGLTRTGLAINYMTNTAFVSREDAPRVAVIITDGNTEGSIDELGTLLGPLIFLAVFDDAVRESPLSEWKFVDDLSLAETRQHDAPSIMQEELNDFNQWASQNHMLLNADKCKVMIFSFMKLPPAPPVLKINGTPLEIVVAKVEDAKDAGITVYVVANGLTALVNNAALEAIAGGPANVFSATGDPCELANRILELCGEYNLYDRRRKQLIRGVA